MDLSFTPEQEAFRAEVRDWLAANGPAERLPSMGTADGFQAHREWAEKLGAAGYVAVHWPVEYGGRGADVVMQAIFEEEYLLSTAPPRVTGLGTHLFGPTLMVHGTEQQKQRWLPDILSSRTLWSQGFSEPEAGSDLAGLRTHARLDGDDWVVTGQKIWTSYGAFADWIFALVRTDAEAHKHAGISFIAIDLRSEGVDPRPISQLDGKAGFAEVFFDEVRVPADQVIGSVNDGWSVAMTTLGFERDAPAAPAARFRRDLNDLVTIARARGMDADAAVRDRLAGLFARTEAYRAHTLRTLTRLSRKESIGSEASRTKLLWSELERDIYETGLDLLGPYGEVLSPEAGYPNVQAWHTRYWFARAATIYAGTSEIQRNILAERVLGLPKG